MTRKHQNLVGEIVDQGQGLPPFVPHQTHGTVVDHVAQQQQILVLERLLLWADEVVPQVVLQFGLLLADIRKVDEKSGTHVPFEHFNFLREGGPVFAHEQVTVLEQAAAPDLLRVAGGDQLFLQMVERLLKVSVHGLAHHRGIEVLANG